MILEATTMEISFGFHDSILYSVSTMHDTWSFFILCVVFFAHHGWFLFSFKQGFATYIAHVKNSNPSLKNKKYSKQNISTALNIWTDLVFVQTTSFLKSPSL